jgi:beta-N-acetylhexosaminidase
VLALEAGVDALLVGHDLGEESVAQVERALVDAVAAGELDEVRLREAAGRVSRAGTWASSPGGAAPDREAGRVAARQALETAGDVALESAPLVVELRPTANIAAGEAGHTLGSVLEEHLPGTQTVVVDEATVGSAEALSALDDRDVVVVVRDAHRHAWMRDATDRLLARVPRAVVVEVGLPHWRPAGAGGYVATYGGGRVNFEAAVARLARAAAVA